MIFQHMAPQPFSCLTGVLTQGASVVGLVFQVLRLYVFDNIVLVPIGGPAVCTAPDMVAVTSTVQIEEFERNI